MKATYALLTAALTMSVAANADAGVIHFSMEADKSTATIGETVNVTVRASIEPGDPFAGFAAAQFNIHVVDPTAGGGVITNTPPLLGLKPDFIAAGNQGVLAGSSINAALAMQFPPMMGPINTSTELDLYSFDYTITNADARVVEFDLEILLSQVYINSITPVTYQYTTDPTSVMITQLPAPGALALLGAAGLVGVRRKRNA